MEGVYKHKETGAEQIFSENTVATLGGEKVWEFLRVFEPQNDVIETIEPVLTDSIQENGLPVINLREVQPEPIKVLPVVEVESKPLQAGKPKAISLKDLDE